MMLTRLGKNRGTIGTVYADYGNALDMADPATQVVIGWSGSLGGGFLIIDRRDLPELTGGRYPQMTLIA